MMDFDDFGSNLPSTALSPGEKAAAVLLAMGAPVAGKLLKYFTQGELQNIIESAQTLRSIPPEELNSVVNEFEDLFTEGTGLMDNAKAIEKILDEGLLPEEVDALLGRRTAFQAYEDSMWDRLQDADPAFVCGFLVKEHPQTIAYILSMLPSAFGAKVLVGLPEKMRADVMKRTVNLKNVSAKAVQIIETRIEQLIREIDEERNSVGSKKMADLMNQLDKPAVDSLLDSLGSVSQESVAKVRPKIFLFEDLMYIPPADLAVLLSDISADVLTMALRGAPAEIRERLLSAISPRQRRMVESDLAAGGKLDARSVAIARRAIAQEAIKLADAGQIVLRETKEDANQAA